MLSFAAYAVTILVLGTAHIFVASVLPYPFSTLNVGLFAAMTILFVTESRAIPWFAFPLFYIIDLYGTLTPFGVTLCAGMASLMAASWIYQSVVTNRSFLAGGLLTVAIVLFFRFLYIALLVLTSLAERKEEGLPWSHLLSYTLWETCITSTTVLVTLFLLSFFVKGLKAKTIEGHLFRV